MSENQDFDKNWNESTRRYTIKRKPPAIISPEASNQELTGLSLPPSTNPSSVDFDQSEISLSIDQSCNDFNEFQEQENLLDTTSDLQLEPLTVESTNQRFQSISIGNEASVGLSFFGVAKILLNHETHP